MEKLIDLVVMVAIVGNKIAVAGIAAWLVWALQELFRDGKWTEAYPFLKSPLVRAGVALVASGFAIDAFTLYTPGISEVLMNVGIVALLFKFRYQYKRNRGYHPIIEVLKHKRKQKSEI